MSLHGACLVLLVWITSCRLSSGEILKVRPLIVGEQLLWLNHNQGEIYSYRIPIMAATSRGSLLALAEARKASSSDAGAKFIALRRSTDKGRTWTPTKFLVNDGEVLDGLNLGAVIVDEQKDLVFVMYTLCGHHYDCLISSVMLIQTSDDGVSWSAPRNISEQVGTQMFMPGPGYGIQKRFEPKKGRLIVCGHGTLPRDGVYCLLSDDHGVKWRFGGSMRGIPYGQPKKRGDFTPDESQPFELPDGSVIVNSRNQNFYHCNCRVIMQSFDASETYPLDYLKFDEKLVDPAVAASAMFKNGVVFFTNPATPTKRINMTLQWSYDNGTTWQPTRLEIWRGPSAYSSLTMMERNTDDLRFIYLIYEKGYKDPYESISFVRIHLYGGLL
uniref:Sialidase-1 n=1 Tax=Eptatretus burgeri TaxID=7764 RepID=A0A8C4PXJ3_EPTBU